MPQQRDLFRDDDKPIGPHPPFLDQDFVPAIEALFRRETSGIDTRSDTPCPLSVNETTPPIIDRVCECPLAHELVKKLGEGLPRCSANRCPVRIVLYTALR